MMAAVSDDFTRDNNTGTLRTLPLPAGQFAAQPRIALSFVGVGYNLHGAFGSSSETNPGNAVTRNTVYIPTNAQKLVQEFESHEEDSLGSWSGLGLSVYKVEAAFPNTSSVVIYNATVQIPIRTPRPALKFIR